MKKSLLCLLLLLISFTAYSKKFPGYFITHSGDTVQVQFKISTGLFSTTPSFAKLQGRVVYFNKEGKKYVLRPTDAQEICIFHQNDTTRMLSRINTLGIITSIFRDNSYIFLKLESDGPVKLFSYEQKSQGGFGSSGMPVGLGVSFSYNRFVLQYENDLLVQVKGISFRRDMMDFFSDYPELVEKIDQRHYRKEDLKTIVREYNDYLLGHVNHQASTPEGNGF